MHFWVWWFLFHFIIFVFRLTYICSYILSGKAKNLKLNLRHTYDVIWLVTFSYSPPERGVYIPFFIAFFTPANLCWRLHKVHILVISNYFRTIHCYYIIKCPFACPSRYSIWHTYICHINLHYLKDDCYRSSFSFSLYWHLLVFRYIDLIFVTFFKGKILKIGFYVCNGHQPLKQLTAYIFILFLIWC